MEFEQGVVLALTQHRLPTRMMSSVSGCQKHPLSAAVTSGLAQLGGEVSMRRARLLPKG